MMRARLSRAVRGRGYRCSSSVRPPLGARPESRGVHLNSNRHGAKCYRLRSNTRRMARGRGALCRGSNVSGTATIWRRARRGAPAERANCNDPLSGDWMKHLFRQQAVGRDPLWALRGSMASCATSASDLGSKFTTLHRRHGTWPLDIAIDSLAAYRRTTRGSSGRSHTRYDACRRGSMTRGREETRIDARRAAQKISQG